MTFDASASTVSPGGTIVDYIWDFGDGASESGVLTTHTYQQTGSYTVKLMVTDDKSKQGTAEQTVIVAASPTGEFISLPTTITDLTGLAWDGQNFWTLDGAEKRLHKFSGSSGQALAVFNLEADYPTAIAWSPESQQLFVLDGNGGAIYKINPSDGSKLDQFEPPGMAPLGMSWGEGSLWVTDFAELKIYKINPENGQRLAALNVNIAGVALQGLTWTETGLWAYDANSDTIYKIDSASGQKIGEALPPRPDDRWSGLGWAESVGGRRARAEDL